MHKVDQFQLDLDGKSIESRLNAQYAANMEAQAYQWTPENMARCWVKIHEEEWQRMPSYEKQRIVNEYQFAQDDLVRAQERWDFMAQWGPQRERRPFLIKDYQPPDWKRIEADRAALHARAKEMANQLSADWSAGRPPSWYTYDPFLASEVSQILGRTVESVLPADDNPYGYGVPLHWLLISSLRGARKLPSRNSKNEEESE